MTATTSPGNVDLSNGHFIWPAVPGATDYLVRLNNDTNKADILVWTSNVELTAGVLVDIPHAGNKWFITIAAINNNGVTMTQSIAESMFNNSELHFGAALEFDSPPAPTTTTTSTTTTTTVAP
ncbi:hypothetical protein [Herbiconiux daphne]|uniref:Uncharacterized protein n=1 Tax=Herbiconiux daphne TaxID=2970914 RepID=A0ABT2HA03_9MICO|nr:hypothetical protein [Herbiconiux daphne]MCS5736785.1 hypothetical protein [Herbiconiux daphne]